MHSYLTVIAVTLLGCLALMSTRRWHGRFSLDSAFGVQKIHRQPTLRIGGLALFIGLVATLITSDDDVRILLGPMLLAAVPAFAFGLAEDLTKMVSVRARLLATMFSGVAAWYLTGVSMQETGLPPLDWVLQFAPAAVLFTAFAVGGVANAVNIIDGFNGLAAGAVAIMLGAISLIALQVGDTALSTVCLIVAMGALAFGAVNWPFGLLFMGDGGAYLLGFLLAWVAVLLPMRHAEINAWATILVCAYPVLEVAFSVRRRRKREGHHPGQPDRLHLHHLIHRRIVCQAFPQLSPGLKNGLTSPICWLLVALPGGAALLFAQNTMALALLFFSVVIAYGAIYTRLTQFRWCFQAATMRSRSAATA